MVVSSVKKIKLHGVPIAVGLRATRAANVRRRLLSTSKVRARLRFPPPHQPPQLAAAGPDPFHELGRHQGVLLSVDLAAQRRALEAG